MRVRVLTEFVDKYSGELREIGSSFECTEERFKEISAAGSYVSVVEEAHTAENASETPKKASKTAKRKSAKGE